MMNITEKVAELKEVQSCHYEPKNLKLTIYYRPEEIGTLSALQIKVGKILTDRQLQNSVEKQVYISC